MVTLMHMMLPGRLVRERGSTKACLKNTSTESILLQVQLQSFVSGETGNGKLQDGLQGRSA